MQRDAVIDGFRAVAVLCVVFSHTVTYRFEQAPHLLQRLAGPLAEIGVQLFFVISGYIITSLLLREEQRLGSVSITAFYARRTFRILPPFLLMIAVAQVGAVEKLKAATFTCNLTECAWGVAHSWSLAVEEQYYLVWPLLFVRLGGQRAGFLIGVIGILLLEYVLRPFTYHANTLSFACIATGALIAVRPDLKPVGRWPLWLLAGGVLVLGPMVGGGKVMGLLTPALVAYLLFGARNLPLVRRLLESAPMQVLALYSYSIYLWQQAFLGPDANWPLWLLPPVVLASVYLIEKPFNEVGHSLSKRLQRVRAEPTSSDRRSATSSNNPA